MDLVDAFQTIGISLGIGLLVGLQRERVDAPLAGIRTFALISLFGTITGMLAISLGPWVVAAGLIAVASASAMGNLLYLKEPRPDAGITTEIAVLLVYGIGAYLAFGHRQVAVVLGGGVAVLLHAKPMMRGFVKRLGETDMRVIMQFVLITLVILPILPNQSYGPFAVFNPREVWSMVVLVVAISLLGYVGFKLFGSRAGVVVSGLIGGLISSTATTVSTARRAAKSPERAAAVVMIVMLASAVVFVRVIVEIAVTGGAEWISIAAPIAVLLVVSIAVSAVLWWSGRKDRVEHPTHGNPAELKSALIFGALYAVVLFVVAAAQHHFGSRGIYVAAGISGLTDMDAITLSTSRMAAGGAISVGVTWRAIVIAIIANLVVKNGIVFVLGGAAIGRSVAIPFAVLIAAAVTLLAAWP